MQTAASHCLSKSQLDAATKGTWSYLGAVTPSNLPSIEERLGFEAAPLTRRLGLWYSFCVAKCRFIFNQNCPGRLVASIQDFNHFGSITAIRGFAFDRIGGAGACPAWFAPLTL